MCFFEEGEKEKKPLHWVYAAHKHLTGNPNLGLWIATA